MLTTVCGVMGRLSMILTAACSRAYHSQYPVRVMRLLCPDWSICQGVTNAEYPQHHAHLR